MTDTVFNPGALNSRLVLEFARLGGGLGLRKRWRLLRART